MRILAENLIHWLVDACESIVEPMRQIRGLIKRCSDSIGLGMSGCLIAKKGRNSCPAHCPLYNGYLFIQRQNQFCRRLSICCWLADSHLGFWASLAMGNIKGTDLGGTGYLPELLLNSCWNNTIATGLQQQGIVVPRSPIYSVAPYQVHYSLISSVCFYKNTVHLSPVLRLPRVLRRSPLLRFYKCCTIHRSPVLHLLQVLHPSSLLRFYSCTVQVLLNLLATILCHVIMLLDDSILSMILQPMWIRLVDYLTASLKSKFLQLPNMLPTVGAFIILSWFSSLTSFKWTFAAPQLNY